MNLKRSLIFMISTRKGTLTVEEARLFSSHSSDVYQHASQSDVLLMNSGSAYFVANDFGVLDQDMSSNKWTKNWNRSCVRGKNILKQL